MNKYVRLSPHTNDWKSRTYKQKLKDRIVAIIIGVSWLTLFTIAIHLILKSNGL